MGCIRLARSHYYNNIIDGGVVITALTASSHFTMFGLHGSPLVAPFLIFYLYAANGAVVMDICIPTSPEMLPPRTTEIFRMFEH